MKTTARHFLFAAVSSLSLAACAAQPGVQPAAPVAAAPPALTGAPLDASVPSQLPRIAAPLHYDVSVTPDAKELTFTGEAGIDIELVFRNPRFPAGDLPIRNAKRRDDQRLER